ncbi:MAG: DUF2070 family protein [Methanobrevibacter woesei]|uniref:DUF2070 family protein n=1 Tax=Methanobrevibacter woesei TaxID=190976 RepID=UPI0023F316B7|nr:DUF2070 family protein [Methanobrevibacter woesei]MCI7291779.1 DUF2070 family protein [Methanobrevibacter woesei]
MSSMSSVAGLSKYITTLPKTKNSILTIIFISFISGALIFLIGNEYPYGIIEKILYGGSFGFGVLGISSIISGGIDQRGIDSLHGINLKTKHSMFLSLLSMTFISAILIIGTLFGAIFHANVFINCLLFGCVLIFGLNTLILWSVTKISFRRSAMIGTIQPLLILAMYVLVSYFSSYSPIIDSSLGSMILKVIVGSVIFILAIYSFITVVESPMKKNLGIGILDLLSLFIAHMNEGSKSLESLFDNMGEPISTVVTFISFRTKKGIKSLFVSPSVHPGPLGDIGGSNMPTILAERFNHFTMIAHGPSTHDFNPVATRELDKIEDAIKTGLEKVEYSPKATLFKRYKEEKANIGVQFFNKGMVILSTFAPEGSDDIEFGVGLTMMTQSKSRCKVQDSIIVDCHNSFTPESGGVLPGNDEVFEIITAIDKIDLENEYHDIKVGCYENPMNDLGKNEGVGESGIKTMVIEVANQKTAYILFDSNNMEIGFRAEIIDTVKELGIDEVEVMTTDTHSVNTISRGYNPIGLTKRPEITEYIKESVIKAIDDLEEVEVGTGTEKIENLKTFGPTNSTELISTISSIVAVSKIIAPVLFISAIIIVIIWIFYT